MTHLAQTASTSSARTAARAAARTGAVLGLVLAGAAGCSDEIADPVSTPASGLEATVATTWMDAVHDAVRSERLSPPVAARIYAYAGLAIYEATVPGMADHASLGGQVQGLAEIHPPNLSLTHDWPSAVNAAAAGVAAGLFASASDATRQGFDDLERLLDGERAAVIADDSVRVRSVAWGNEVARSVLAAVVTDGYAANAGPACAHAPAPGGPSIWHPTAPAYAPALQPCWGNLRTLAVPDATTCDAAAPTTWSLDHASAFHAEADEVFRAVNELDAERRAIALFWSDDPGLTGTPPGHWIHLVGQLARERGYTLDVAAEAYARVGIAEHDAFVTCWHTKFEWNVVRPITYIRENIAAKWTPLLVTPPFPEYTSGHSIQSSAATTVLQDLLGASPYVDHTHDARGLAPRSFASFTAAADEAAISRLYGGIHYRPAIEQGLAQGHCVATHVLSLRFRR